MRTFEGFLGGRFRLMPWLIFSIALIATALVAQQYMPGSVVAVSLYKLHLLALAGWGGYWLDRALFPYDRPHEYLQMDEDDAAKAQADAELTMIVGNAFALSMMRRAVVVAACLICVGLGA